MCITLTAAAIFISLITRQPVEAQIARICMGNGQKANIYGPSIGRQFFWLSILQIYWITLMFFAIIFI